MKQIELHSRKWPGLFALVDDSDWELVNQYRWCPRKGKTHRTFYAQTNAFVDGKRTTIKMHRLIMGFPACEVDHDNGHGLDNQRHNLREATDSQNKGNVAKFRGSYTSQFKGVSWHRFGSKWRAQVGMNGKQQHLGYFTDEIDAARAYDRKAIELFGEFALTNFPVSDYQSVQLPLAA